MTGATLADTDKEKVLISELTCRSALKSPTSLAVNVTLMLVSMPAARGPGAQEACKGAFGLCTVNLARSRDTFVSFAV